MLEKLGMLAFGAYIAWMVVAGRTTWWSSRDHPHAFWFNYRWVFRDEEPGFYWAAVAFHVALLAAMAYLAFRP